MNFTGVLIGISAFAIIGLLHPVVIKTEYHFGTKAWPAFLIAGLACVGIALWQADIVVSSIFSVLGFSLFWSIHELFEQKKRVAKGWFPKKGDKKE